MKFTVNLVSAMSICAFASVVNASNVADGDIVTFTANTAAKASEVNGNFTALKNAVNDNDTRITTNANAITTNAATAQTAIGQMFSGDGSASNLAVTANVDWNSAPPANPSFNNITIGTGFTLTVPAGTTIRCAGSFTNNGTLLVSPGAETDGAFTGLSTTGGASGLLTAIAHPGDTPRAATLGNSENTAAVVSLGGGIGGAPIPQATLITSLANFKLGGGAGAGYDSQGAQGGGLVKIYCNGAIVNNGTISTVGETATNTSIGGGGGGIVILASRTLVDNTSGTITATGGSSSSDATFGGHGGGGGGGIVVMASPTAPVLGTVNVTGGTGATGVATVNVSIGRTAGAGGGGSGGAGGNGGSVSTVGAKSAATNGAAGYSVEMTLDPAFITR